VEAKAGAHRAGENRETAAKHKGTEGTEILGRRGKAGWAGENTRNGSRGVCGLSIHLLVRFESAVENCRGENREGSGAKKEKT
jgi:hypothetical protein